eukprot:2892775-Pyramimonas_sp.AAC.2
MTVTLLRGSRSAALVRFLAGRRVASHAGSLANPLSGNQRGSARAESIQGPGGARRRSGGRSVGVDAPYEP